ncbi:MAG: hypothetical protein U1E65_29010 [Myxococcota bacterium]
MRLHTRVCLACTLFALTYAALAIFEVPLLWYLPIDRRFEFGLKPSSLGIDWYGRVLAASLASAVGLGLGGLFRPRSPVILRWILVLSLISAASVFSVAVLERSPKPEPLPSWYVPR